MESFAKSLMSLNSWGFGTVTAFDCGYLGFLASAGAASGYWGLLRGKGPNSTTYLKTARCVLFMLFWYPMFRLHNNLSMLWWLYLPSYLDMSEFTGARISAPFRAGVVSKLLRDYLDCSLVRTCEINEPQCIFAMHPHGILPLAGVVNMGSDVCGFEEKFPTLKKRVLAAASMVSLFPIYRDVVLAVGVVDCARFSFEGFLSRGFSVGVFVGGAFEALRAYAHADREILDLRRKKGFLRLSMIHNIPVVPCYTFNEVDHVYQIRDELFSKTFLLSGVRRLFNRITGIILPCILPYILRGKNCVTVVGGPIHFKMSSGGVEPTDDELEAAMNSYVVALTDLYNKHAPKYNRRQDRRLVVS